MKNIKSRCQRAVVSVQTGEQERADNHGDENLHAGIHIAFCLLGSNGGLNGNSCTLATGLDFLNKLLHGITSFFLFIGWTD